MAQLKKRPKLRHKQLKKRHKKQQHQANPRLLRRDRTRRRTRRREELLVSGTVDLVVTKGDLNPVHLEVTILEADCHQEVITRLKLSH